jgi:DeoR/GlpR family transcriptional regulator of sugar metabolism
MAQHAKKTIVMTDSSKFSKQGTVIQFPADDVYAVYTDSKCPESVVQMLKEHNVIVDTGGPAKGALEIPS